MRPIIIITGFIIGAAFIAAGCWLLFDTANADYINPVPTTAPMTEIDLAAHVDDNQLEAQKDATGKISMVAMAGYSTIASLEGMHTFRDIAVIAGLCFLGWVWLQGKRKSGGK